MTSGTIGGVMTETARRVRVPGVVEARIATAPNEDGNCYVTARSLTGDNQRLGPFAAGHLHIHDGEDITTPLRGDPCWIGMDQGGDPACIVAWRPRG